MMRLNETILVMEKKGRDWLSSLMNWEDYRKNYVDSSKNGLRKASAADLFSTIGDKDYWSEVTVNSTPKLRARFCTDIKQLQSFLYCVSDGRDRMVLDEEHCSEGWKELLDSMEIKADGRDKFFSHHYEDLKENYEVGQVIHNMNGSDYRVMEKYSNTDLLLMNLKDGAFVVALGTHTYARHPKEAPETEDNVIVGVSWDHGRYLSNAVGNIDFEGLRRDYCKEPEPDKDGKYQIEIREILSRVENIKADNLGDAIDKAMEMYQNSEVVLDAEDYKGVDYVPVEEKAI